MNNKRKKVVMYIIVSFILITVFGYISYLVMTDNLISDTFNQKEHITTNEKFDSTLTE